MAQSGAVAYAKVVACAWRDAAFKAQLLADPEAVLLAAGVPVPPGLTVTVVEGSVSKVEMAIFILPVQRHSD